MNNYLKMFMAPVLGVLLVGCASTSSPRYTSNQQPAYSQQQYSKAQRPQHGRMETITGKVTDAGGLMAENGTPYRLNGAKAADLRNYANQTVTVKGYAINFEGSRAIIVESFQASNVSQTERGNQNRQDPSSNQPNYMDTDGQNRQAKPDTDNSNLQFNLDTDRSNQQFNPDTNRSDQNMY